MAKRTERYKKVLQIDKILGDVVENIVDKKKSPLLRIEMAWNKALSSAIAKNCTPERFRRGVLTVKCTNSIWKSEMLFYKEELIEKINKELGEELIKDVYFV
ncbi:DUF721 domain-containing protein [Bacteroidetes/Chlorobi group bacterium Naka2016]|jgi:hypothetical protein|nr:MAG: DUF721 domain-containing protein [Bacteroidetes/Chlorobi group bacterium Naka2016]